MDWMIGVEIVSGSDVIRVVGCVRVVAHESINLHFSDFVFLSPTNRSQTLHDDNTDIEASYT